MAATRVRWVLALTLGVLLLTLPPAHAYIDAGSTSVVFQAIVAFIMAAGVTLKLTWHRIMGRFSRSSRHDVSEDEAASVSSPEGQ